MKIHNPFTDKAPIYIPVFATIVGAFILAFALQFSTVKVLVLIGIFAMAVRLVYFLLKGK